MLFLPTRTALISTAILIALTIFAAQLPLLIHLAEIGGVLLIIFAGRDLWREKSALNTVRLTRIIPTIVPRGKPFTVELTIENLTDTSLFLILREILPAMALPALRVQNLKIPPRGKQIIKYQLTLTQRGDFTIGASFLRKSGVLLAAQWSAENFSLVKVYPEVIAAREEFAAERGTAAAEKSRQAHERGAGMEFLTLSPFQVGDARRHIDWRASARAGKLLTRRFQIEQHREIMILVDTGRLMGMDIGGMSKLDCAVNSALMLNEIAGIRGDKCGLGIFSDRVHSYLPPQNERSGAAFNEYLYQVQSEFRETDFQQMFAVLQNRQKKRALIVILSDFTDNLASANFRLAMSILAKRHLLIFAAFRSPQLDDLFAAPFGDWQIMTEKALAYRLARERENTLKTLAFGGIEVIDANPNEITAPLLNNYLRLRETNRL